MIHYIDMSMTFGGMTGKKRESENLVHLWIYICVIFILTIWTCQVLFSSANLFQKLMTIIICFIEFQNLKREKNNNRKMILDQIKRKFIEYLRDSMANEIENRVYFPSSSFIFIFFTASLTFLYLHRPIGMVMCVRTIATLTKLSVCKCLSHTHTHSLIMSIWLASWFLIAFNWHWAMNDIPFIYTHSHTRHTHTTNRYMLGNRAQSAWKTFSVCIHFSKFMSFFMLKFMRFLYVKVNAI